MPIKNCGESAAVNLQSVENFRQKLADLLSEYSTDDVYNADETTLFYKCLPHKTLTYKGDRCHGSKWSKERITILPIVNMSGKIFTFPDDVAFINAFYYLNVNAFLVFL